MRLPVLSVLTLSLLACGGLFEPGPQYLERVVEEPADPLQGMPEGTVDIDGTYGDMDDVYCKPCDVDGVRAAIKEVRASSTAPPTAKASHDPARAVDGDVATAWCATEGEGAWLEVLFERPVDLKGVEAFAGWFKTEYQVFRHQRVARMLVTPDVGAPVHVTFDVPKKGPRGFAESTSKAVMIPGKYPGVSKLRFEVLETHPGREELGVCVSSFRLLGRPS